MSRPCPLPSCTRNPRSCTPLSLVNGANSRRQEIYRFLPLASPPLPISKRNVSFTTGATAPFGRKTGGMLADKLADGLVADVHRKRTNSRRRRCLEPAASWNATRRPDPLTASQKLLLRVAAPPPSPRSPGYPGALPRSASAAALLVFSCAGTQITSPLISSSFSATDESDLTSRSTAARVDYI